MLVAAHVRCVQRIGVTLGDGGEEVFVLPDRDGELADLIPVVHGPVPGRIGGVPRVPNRHQVDRDRPGRRLGKPGDHPDDRRGDDDAVVICLGVNDALRGTGLATWEAEITALAMEIHQRMGEIDLLFCGPPPLGEFPAFPVPLRGFLGRRAEGLSRSLARVVERTERALLAPPLSPVAPHHFCRDRFHPGAEGYRAWGGLIADQLAARPPYRSR